MEGQERPASRNKTSQGFASPSRLLPTHLRQEKAGLLLSGSRGSPSEGDKQQQLKALYSTGLFSRQSDARRVF